MGQRAGISGMDGKGSGEIFIMLKWLIKDFFSGSEIINCNYLHFAIVTYKPIGECQLFGDFVDIEKRDVNSLH